MREKKPANRDSTRIFVIVTALTILFAVVFSPIVCADQTEPSNPPPEPTLTIAKDVGTGEIVLTWTATTSPYSVSRHTGPYFFDGNSPQVLAAGLLGTTYVDASLGDGINRFYIIEDANAAPRVYSLSSNAALPGSSVTVSGVGFDSSSPSANEVLVTGEPATVTAVTDSTVTNRSIKY